LNRVEFWQFEEIGGLATHPYDSVDMIFVYDEYEEGRLEENPT